MKNETQKFWSEEFGDSYHKRCRVNWRSRIPFWDRIVQITGIRSVFEVGTGPGWNLSAIKHTNHGYNVNVRGCDVNNHAIQQAVHCGLDVYCGDGFGQMTDCTEMVFTSGVLIHVSPSELNDVMNNIVRVSSDYVLAIEYDYPVEQEIEYRGHQGKLWKRPYGKLYESMGLTLVETGLLGEKDGFDPNGVTYWLLRK